MNNFTWKRLLTMENLNEGKDEFAGFSEMNPIQFFDVHNEVIPVVKEILEENNVPNSFQISFLSKNRMIYGMVCNSKERAISWLQNFSLIYGDIIAVKCKLYEGIALVANAEELVKN